MIWRVLFVSSPTTLSAHIWLLQECSLHVKVVYPTDKHTAHTHTHMLTGRRHTHTATVSLSSQELSKVLTEVMNSCRIYRNLMYGNVFKLHTVNDMSYMQHISSNKAIYDHIWLKSEVLPPLHIFLLNFWLVKSRFLFNTFVNNNNS